MSGISGYKGSGFFVPSKISSKILKLSPANFIDYFIYNLDNLELPINQKDGHGTFSGKQK